MRVISGIAKNKRLKAPTGMKTRPITDMIKEALFNVLGSNIENKYFLDLFSGSGSVGIEALSRGAYKAVFVDSSNAAVKVIKENLLHCNLMDRAEIYCNDVFKALEILERRGCKFQYIFVDPPFTNEGIFIKVITALDGFNILEDNGVLVIRSHKGKDMPDKLQTIYKDRCKNYGESTLHYYHLMGGSGTV